MGLITPWYPEFNNAARSNAERVAYSRMEMLKTAFITTPLTAAALGVLAGCVVAIFTTGLFVPIAAAATVGGVVFILGAAASVIGHITRVESLT